MVCATDPVFLWPFLVAVPSVALDGRDRLAAASWKVARAGVEGLLALPLLVVTVGGTGGGTDSLFLSDSSALVSFFVGIGVGRLVLLAEEEEGVSGLSMVSFFDGFGLDRGACFFDGFWFLANSWECCDRGHFGSALTVGVGFICSRRCRSGFCIVGVGLY